MHRRGGVSQHALGRGCVSQHALGRLVSAQGLSAWGVANNPLLWTEWQTGVKTLPCRSFVEGGNELKLYYSDISEWNQKSEDAEGDAEWITTEGHGKSRPNVEPANEIPGTSKEVLRNTLCQKILEQRRYICNPCGLHAKKLHYRPLIISGEIESTPFL